MDADASPTLYIEARTELGRVNITTQYHQVNTQTAAHLLHLISLCLALSVCLSLRLYHCGSWPLCVSVRLCTGAAVASRLLHAAAQFVVSAGTTSQLHCRHCTG